MEEILLKKISLKETKSQFPYAFSALQCVYEELTLLVVNKVSSLKL